MFSFLAPYKWMIEIAAILTVIGGIFYGVFAVLKYEQNIGYKKAVSEYTVKQLAAEQAARSKELEWSTQLQKARDDANSRNQKINELSRNLDSATSRLRDTIAALRDKLATDSEATLRDRADVALRVFGECTERYTAVARDAEQHSSGKQEIKDAWPK
jgi:chromosome segregation ATPase